MDIVFDFDGVLCEYEGWRGHDKIGEPIAVMIELVKKLGCDNKLKLSTTRLNPYPFGDYDSPDELVVSGKVKQIIEGWLQKQDILLYFDEITGYKPFGDIYIDDRGFYFNKHHYHWNDLQERLELIVNKKDEEKGGDNADSSHA
jgi:hypothetical protein